MPVLLRVLADGGGAFEITGESSAVQTIVLDAVSRGLPIRDAYLRVLLPAQQEIGRLWHLNQISISEEHLVSYTTQRVMALLSTRMPRKPDNGFTAIAGSVAGNVHDIGIRAVVAEVRERLLLAVPARDDDPGSAVDLPQTHHPCD